MDDCGYARSGVGHCEEESGHPEHGMAISMTIFALIGGERD
jgi:hypothetical protein